MHKIEAELTRATHFKAKGRTGQQLYKGLIEAVKKLPEDDWERLSTKAKLWTNDGVAALKKHKLVSKFPETGNGPLKPKAKIAKATSFAKTSSNTPKTATQMIQQQLLHDPKVPVEDLIEKLQHAGFNATTWFVATTRSNFRNAIKMIQREGVDVRKLVI